MNAVRQHAGEWRPAEGSVNKTSFDFYPDFNCYGGKPGDTVIWYPKENKLEIASPKAKYPALCISPKIESKNLTN